MRGMLPFTLIATLLTAQGVAAQSAPDVPAQIVSAPSAKDLAQYYPAKDIAEQKIGHTVMRCTVSLRGALSICEIAAADGPEFGPSALRAARLYKVQPALRNGSPVESMIDVETTWTPPS